MTGERWDMARAVRHAWLPGLLPEPVGVEVRSAIFLPKGNRLAQWSERWLPSSLPWGGFLAIGLTRPVSAEQGLAVAARR